MEENKSTIEIRELSSKLLGRKIKYCTILPENYQSESAHKFPVLYLLHGLFGRFDNWITNTKIVEYARKFAFVIVCVDGGDNWYSDSPKLPNHFYESYFFEELVPDVEQHFTVGRKKKMRAVAGLSMGGYGAFKFAFRQPEMFCFAASMSGAFHAAEVFANPANENWKEIHESILKIFGETENEFRAENNLLKTAKNFPAEKISSLPYFYFNCGVEDAFLPVNQQLAKIFRQHGIAHNFQAFAGGHDWLYWDKNIDSTLKLAAKIFED